jgi:hypothetical protein
MKINFVLCCTFEGGIWIDTKIEKISSINLRNEGSVEMLLLLIF